MLSSMEGQRDGELGALAVDRDGEAGGARQVQKEIGPEAQRSGVQSHLWVNLSISFPFLEPVSPSVKWVGWIQ